MESTDLAGILGKEARSSLLIDGIGTWLAAVLAECGVWDQLADPAAGAAGLAGAMDKAAGRIDDLVAAWRQTPAHAVAVSDEVGSGVVPPTRSGGLFRDQLGWLNQRLAAESDRTVLVVAGQVTTLPS